MKIRNVALGVHIATFVIAVGFYFPAYGDTSYFHATTQMAIVYRTGYFFASFLSGLVATATVERERDQCLLAITSLFAFLASNHVTIL